MSEETFMERLTPPSYQEKINLQILDQQCRAHERWEVAMREAERYSPRERGEPWGIGWREQYELLPRGA